MDIAAWLRGLSLERYAGAFRDNAIELEVLPQLSEADLEKIGVLLGHRKIMLKAIAALGPQAPQPLPEPTPAVPAEAERRQLTVMFCDLVGSTPLSARLDPEDLRGIIGAYHRCVTEIVESFCGFVARYMGDGVLVYFGYPQAHEDDAERATRCGLALVDRCRGSIGPKSSTPGSGLPPGWLSLAARLPSMMSLAIHPISPRVCRPWPSPTLS
jgi:hypothetical protein